MTEIFYVAPRFTKYFVNDIFTNKMVECDEDLFDSIVVKFRSSFKLEYIPGGQRFTDGVYTFERYY